MPDDVDRSLLRLAVDNGFLTRDEGMRYWQQLQAPGSPRFIQLLLQSGRLGRPEVDRLRALWQQSGGQSPSGITAAFSRSGPQPALPPGPAVAVAPAAAPAATIAPPHPSPSSQNPASTDDGSWEEALEKDTQLARALYSRGLVTQERLRECRALQLQHRLRLGVVLLRKNYVDRAALDDATRSLGGSSGSNPGLPPVGSGAHPGLGASTRMAAPPAPQGPLALGGSTRVQAPAPGALPPGLGGSTRMPAPQPVGLAGPMHAGRPGAPTSTNPFQAPPGDVDQDAMPTLNVPPGSFPPGAPFSPRGGLTPQDAIPTLLGAMGDVSVEELNPFAVMGGAPGGAAASAPRANGGLSVDELNAFDDVPLGPPPSSGGAAIDGPSASGEDITLPPSWSPAAQPAAAPAEGAAAPGGGLPDSGGERPAAAKKKTTLKKAAPEPARSGGGSSKALIIFVVIALLIAAAAGAFLTFG